MQVSFDQTLLETLEQREARARPRVANPSVVLHSFKCGKSFDLLAPKLFPTPAGSPRATMRFCLMVICKLLCHLMTWPLGLVRITGLYRRLFPALAYNITFSYNEKMHQTKRDLFRSVAKFANSDGTLRLLEIGCGSGANFQFYPDGCTVVCTDPNPHFQQYLRRSMDANAHLSYGDFLVVPAEDMAAVHDESVDVVVCTLVLCSVEDVRAVLQEVRRILRPVSLCNFSPTLHPRKNKNCAVVWAQKQIHDWLIQTRLHVSVVVIPLSESK